MTATWSRDGASADRGLHLGDGLFETILLTCGVPQWLSAHLARLRRSGDVLSVGVPDDLDEVLAAVVPDLWRAVGSPARAALRVTVSRGPWTGFAPSVRDDGRAGLYLVVRALADGPSVPSVPSLRLVVVDRPRIDPLSPLSGHKTLSYMAHVEARRQAVAKGADAALLLTSDGAVAECDAANLFVVRGGQIATPSLDSGVLPGVTRARVLQFLREEGNAAVERSVSIAEILAAGSGAFATSSLLGLATVSSLDGKPLAPVGDLVGRLADCIRQGDARTA